MGKKRRIVRSIGGVLSAVAVVVIVGAAPAGADVVSPPGACTGSGTWEQGGLTESSTQHSSGDVIEVPAKDTVHWSGAVKGGKLGGTTGRRSIDGKVEVGLPVGWTKIDDWGGTSVRVANEGEHDYDVPKLLAGIKMKLRGTHSENGALVCSGSVYVKVKGSNPLMVAGIAGTVIFGLLLLFAGRPKFSKTRPAFEDVNQG